MFDLKFDSSQIGQKTEIKIRFFLALEQQSVEKEICVSLNDEETRIVFIDRKHGELSVGGK